MFTNKPAAMKLRHDIKGIDQKILVKGNKKGKYIYFDNAASTPPLIPILKEVNDYLNWYSGVHRGTGYKSLVSSRIYDECHEIIGKFVGADLSTDTVIFVKNTTEAINKLSYRLQLKSQDIVVISAMEHHSNELPWRARAQVKYANVDNNGTLDLNHMESLLKRYHPQVKLLAVCGASNVTGHVNDVHLLAKMAHAYGCKILVDGAQLVPHQPFNMKAHSDSDHIDFLAFSGHKIYAPFGLGVLIGPRETFMSGAPEYQGGGTIKLVMKNQVFWANPPDKEEAGSPNMVGAFALARTLKYLDKLGMDKLAKHEAELTAYALEKLGDLKFLKVYGSQPRVGVISFNLKDLPHALVGAILCFEAGIGLRTGCFCAQNYVRHLLGVKEDYQQLEFYERNEIDKIPGMVRISLAPYNTREEIDHLIKWLRCIVENRYEFRRRYKFSPVHGGFIPAELIHKGYIDDVYNRYMGL
ncbi:MAG: aminotransferase class V-fold PLP-dependent enzyme [Syntrophomonas sp.]|nr:aminotransferase class V-fold PLP-dependent enzyme [Syntrophomonas sp.]